jgi:hypothetical protein
MIGPMFLFKPVSGSSPAPVNSPPPYVEHGIRQAEAAANREVDDEGDAGREDDDALTLILGGNACAAGVTTRRGV